MAAIMTKQTAAQTTSLQTIRDLLGPSGWIDDATDMAPYLVEHRGLFQGACAGIARPATADEVAGVLAICAKVGICVTPQGGNTGLVGGGGRTK